MIGREREAGLIHEVLDAARRGRSGALVVTGEPGIGKTSLLDDARARADGFLLLETSGAEAESRLAFSGLADLLAPLLDGIDDLPPPQADALRAALGMGPSGAGDRFTAYLATMRLLASAAERRPVLCLIDDAHWLDGESLEAVLFACRRLGAEGVVVLLAARAGVSDRIDTAPVANCRLSGLGVDDAARLVTRSAAASPSPEVVMAIVRGAAGNPLALIELAGALTTDQLAGRAPLPDPLPVGPYLERALLRLLAGLPDATQRALRVASADDGAGDLLAGALRAHGLSVDDLEPAERAGVIEIGPTRTRFSHTLVRSAIYQSADAPDRRRAHAAFAEAAAALGDAAALDRRAWHLALAGTGPDATTAAALEEAAGRAVARTAYAAATEALETAARLSPEAIDRGRRLTAAGQAALAAGAMRRASGLFDEVVALAAAPEQVLEAMIGRGFAEMSGGSARTATDILEAAAGRVREAAPAVAATLFVQAAVPCFMRMDLVRARRLCDSALELEAYAPPEAVTRITVASAIVDIYRGEDRSVPEDQASALIDRGAKGDPTDYIWSLGHLQTLMVRERYAEAIEGLDRIIATARERGMPSVLPWPLAARAEVHRRTGRLGEATADADEALRLAEDTDQSLSGYAHAILGLVHAVLGREHDCRAHATAAREASETTQADSLAVFADGALGLLALAGGDLDLADGHLTDVDRRLAEIGALHPMIDVHDGDLVETRIRLGKLADAEEALARLEQSAERTGAVWALAAAARCRGLIAPDDAFEEPFAEALALHDRTTTPFERARTLLCLGERRRRARRARAAREALQAALATFESLGAATWAAWARRELRAAGARPRDPRPAAAVALTPQELQVALAVAGGATNKEAAATLLISPKTVEFHLGRVYGKLGIRSRTELVRMMAQELA